jgi:hypothetical protein
LAQRTRKLPSGLLRPHNHEGLLGLSESWLGLFASSYTFYPWFDFSLLVFLSVPTSLSKFRVKHNLLYLHRSFIYGEAVSRCFTQDAIVKDEGHTHKGRAAIKAWKTDTSAKYQYTSEPFACEAKDGGMAITSHLVGNFPGSPVDLRYFFKLEGDKIAWLEIIP